MPWNEVTTLHLRKEFVILALKDNSNISRLCRRFGISRKIGYKWINRFLEGGDAALIDKSRKPKNSPKKTPGIVEDEIISLRDKHPEWGPRKIKKRLEVLGVKGLPAPSTINDILRRNDRINKEESQKHKPWKRFEAENPNDLWQMDFKGWFKTAEGACHPLTILDDHSRYSIGIEACRNEQGITVREHLIKIFRQYGLPNAILSDNGAPFGAGSYSPYTRLGAWLIRLGIHVIHGRPRHPQTQGKDERFHRSLQAEVIKYFDLNRIDIQGCQKEFNIWRFVYNHERPHESLGMGVPSDRYIQSKKSYPEELPQIEYGPDDIVRKVRDGGRVVYKSMQLKVGKAFIGEYVALRYSNKANVFDVYYCNQKIKEIDLNKNYGA